MMHDPVITVTNVSKTFSVPKRKDATVLSHIVQTIAPKQKRTYDHPDSLQALSNVNLSVPSGGVFGIIGRNASGKSTLLRVIAGIIKADSGDVKVHGSITSLINLSVGLQQRLTVRDNIFLTCALFGMHRQEAEEKFDSIITFGELEQYVDMYPFQLSSGMQQRLAFSIAIHSEPEILLLDEVFSAGDAAFRNKAVTRMEQLVCSDVTVVMASHELDRVRDFADHVLWLDKGHVQMEGDSREVVQAYMDMYE
jgi:ABC-2 type transport system ATP-binding protein/teichoic acid transport system ATP-binding protein